MALLKKLRSATLVEALVATVLVVIIFVVSSLVLNNLLLNSFSGNTHAVETRMAELTYSARNSKLTLPYSEDFKQWRIQMKTQESDGKTWLITSGINNESGKEIIKNTLCKTEN